MDGKTRAIVAHFTLIGWIIALIVNNSDDKGKDELASFYIRQMLGLILIWFALQLVRGFLVSGFSIGGTLGIPGTGIYSLFIGSVFTFLGIAVFILWILSLVGAAGGEKKLTPFFGEYFQDWFKSL